ncbi:hypothetical protein ACFOGJ_24665 [Marinibaculum pumilum]|uniref:Uncharacterized protein n=1 Tax=Marinibaculum pumilum TaxID=1766165 RepID=A0ABV7L7G1_9PROT
MNIQPSLSPVLLPARPEERPPLPNEPVVRDWPRQAALSAACLAPELAALERFFLWLRAELDPRLRAAKPVSFGKSYPLGQCLEISRAAKLALRGLNGMAPPEGPARRGRDALHAFLAAGGTMRQVWGDLRGAYFQNAFLVGTYYVDIANDTVIAAKPKVEIKPLAEADFRPVRDFAHYATVARRYWDARVLPNHLLPELAPWVPAVTIYPGSGVQLDAPTYYMVALCRAGAFAPSEALLAAAPLAHGLFDLLAGRLAAAGLAVPVSPQAGREAALAACRQGRAAGWPLDDGRADRAVRGALHASRQLAGITAAYAFTAMPAASAAAD